jgi:hypothetical protein
VKLLITVRHTKEIKIIINHLSTNNQRELYAFILIPTVSVPLCGISDHIKG